MLKRVSSTETTLGLHSAATPRSFNRADSMSASSITAENQEKILPDMYQSFFLHCPVSLWIEDFSGVKHRIDQIKRKSGHDLRTFFKRRPEEVIALARKVKIIEVNQATLRLYKAKNKDALCQRLSQVFNKESYDVFREELIALADGKTAFSSEAVNNSLDGQEFRMLIHVKVLPGFEQTLSRIIVSINDITEMKSVEADLRESEEKYRKIFESACDAIFIADPDTGILLGANAKASKLVGIPSEKIIGMHCTELHPVEERKHCRQLFERHVGEEGLLSDDVLLRHQSGKQMAVSISSSMVKIGDRKYIVGVFRKTPAHETKPTEHAVGSATKNPVLDECERLTRRECEVLRQIAAGYANKQIAQRLSISQKTVATHRTRLMKKLNCHNAAQLIKHAVASRLIE